MQALFWSFLSVLIAEIGDKTQLLTLVLSARFRQPTAILAGIIVATLLNHSLAGLVGQQLGAWLGDWQKPVIGGSFLLMGAWALIPDTLEEKKQESGRGAFLSTLISFFLAEMGDKTQIATIALSANWPGQGALVVAGSTLGLMGANAPVIWLGDWLTRRVDLSRVRYLAALLFFLTGIWVIAYS